MLAKSLVVHVMRSSEFIRDLYVCLFQQAEAQGVEWLKNLQARGAVA